MRFSNARNLPKIFYGLHFAPGVAEYTKADGTVFRVFINEDTAKKMDATYTGKPVYVRHVNEVDLDNIQNEADGYVFDSFYNPADGKHWVRFIAVSDAAQDAIRKGWKLSNSYQPKQMTGGGLWHGVEFQNEIQEGEYDHLAIVENPRYSESIVLTPDEFKQYNEGKAAELATLKNEGSKPQGGRMKWFRRESVKNADDLASMSVELPKSKVEVPIVNLINAADELELAKVQGKPVQADPSHVVTLHDGSVMNVAELLERHKNLCSELETLKNPPPPVEEEVPPVDPNADPGADVPPAPLAPEDEQIQSATGPEEDAKAKKALEDLAAHEGEEIAAKKAGVQNAAEEAAKLAKEKATRLRNAADRGAVSEARTVETLEDQVQRGRSRYGS